MNVIEDDKCLLEVVKCLRVFRREASKVGKAGSLLSRSLGASKAWKNTLQYTYKRMLVLSPSYAAESRS